jgi:hypothetical protein
VSLIEENYAHLSALALTAARAAKKRYPVCDLDDLLQVAMMWCVTHPGKLGTYLHDEDERRGTRMLTASMRNAARKWAREDRAASYGYDLDDDAFYSKRMLKGDGNSNKPGLLYYVFNRSNWPKPPPVEGGARSKGDPAEGGTWLTMMVDLSAAIEALPKDELALLERHFGAGHTYEFLGRQATPPVSKATVAKRIDRAVGKVQAFLGGPKPREDEPEEGWDSGVEPEYVGTRRVVSNAHARAITDNQ